MQGPNLRGGDAECQARRLDCLIILNQDHTNCHYAEPSTKDIKGRSVFGTADVVPVKIKLCSTLW
jgi:hypothetical protein